MTEKPKIADKPHRPDLVILPVGTFETEEWARYERERKGKPKADKWVTRKCLGCPKEFRSPRPTIRLCSGCHVAATRLGYDQFDF